jgi:hypothetical protein
MKNSANNAEMFRTGSDGGVPQHPSPSRTRAATATIHAQHGVESGRKPPAATAEHQREFAHSQPDLSLERHYSVAELAGLWSLSENTIRRMFEVEPGVLLLRTSEKRFKRAYTTLRIPESVALRVHRRLSIAG